MPCSSRTGLTTSRTRTIFWKLSSISSSEASPARPSPVWAVGTRIGQGADGGGQHVDQVVELLRPAQPVAHAQQPVDHPVQTGRLLAARTNAVHEELRVIRRSLRRYGRRLSQGGGHLFVDGSLLCDGDADASTGMRVHARTGPRVGSGDVGADTQARQERLAGASSRTRASASSIRASSTSGANNCCKRSRANGAGH